MERRTGDTIDIDGGYQYHALKAGNAIQRFWHETKQLAIADLLPPEKEDTVLDVGCGSGVITGFLAQQCRAASGIDGNENAIAFARKQFGRQNTAFIHGLVDEDFQLEEKADKIYCLEVIEHLYEEQGTGMLRCFRNVLKKDGRVFLTTPNYRSLWPIIEWTMDTFGLAPKMDRHQHVTHYHPALLRKTAARAGFSVEKLVTVSLLSPWVAPLSHRLAHACYRREIRNRLPAGSILCAVLKPDSSAVPKP
jgi:2-polyprenyl-3-methyl-5-hydroxy-6-metoxy-1,4-benzoquinol methylase